MDRDALAATADRIKQEVDIREAAGWFGLCWIRESASGLVSPKPILAPPSKEKAMVVASVVEIWKPVPIPGFESAYSVSSLGRVRSGTVDVLSPKPSANGYIYVTIYSGGVSRRVTVHNLVCRAFNGPAPGPVGCRRGQWQVDHVDFVRTNNSASNLRWRVKEENLGRMPDRRGFLAPNRTLTLIDIAEIRRLAPAVRDGRVSMRSVGRRFGVRHTTIRNVLLGISW